MLYNPVLLVLPLADGLIRLAVSAALGFPGPIDQI